MTTLVVSTLPFGPMPVITYEDSKPKGSELITYDIYIVIGRYA